MYQLHCVVTGLKMDCITMTYCCACTIPTKVSPRLNAECVASTEQELVIGNNS